jgi:hypothetical protein
MPRLVDAPCFTMWLCSCASFVNATHGAVPMWGLAAWMCWVVGAIHLVLMSWARGLAAGALGEVNSYLLRSSGAGAPLCHGTRVMSAACRIGLADGNCSCLVITHRQRCLVIVSWFCLMWFSRLHRMMHCTQSCVRTQRQASTHARTWARLPYAISPPHHLDSLVALAACKRPSRASERGRFHLLSSR